MRPVSSGSLSAGGMWHKDTLRPSRMRPWQSYFLDRPALGGEVTALAGYHGLTFVTTADARAAWGTPGISPERSTPLSPPGRARSSVG